ncbi:MAG: hypothetical protein ABIA02_01815 [Candidatus Falkowbacteria bacterium]
MNNFIKNKKGNILLISILILTSILVAVLGTSSLVISNLKMSGTQENSTKAYFAAEAGAERILWETRDNGFNLGACIMDDYVDFSTNPATCDNSGTVHNYTLNNNASYNVMFAGTGVADFKSTGSYGGVQRTVDIGY